MIAPNKYHLIVDLRKTDFERIETIAADALHAARQALEALEPTEVLPLSQLRDLRQIVEMRSALTQTSRHLIRDILAQIAERARTDPDHCGRACDHLTRSLHFANRVADLIAAERHIGHCRGI